MKLDQKALAAAERGYELGLGVSHRDCLNAAILSDKEQSHDA